MMNASLPENFFKVNLDIANLILLDVLGKPGRRKNSHELVHGDVSTSSQIRSSGRLCVSFLLLLLSRFNSLSPLGFPSDCTTIR